MYSLDNFSIESAFGISKKVSAFCQPIHDDPYGILPHRGPWQTYYKMHEFPPNSIYELVKATILLLVSDASLSLIEKGTLTQVLNHITFYSIPPKVSFQIFVHLCTSRMGSICCMVCFPQDSLLHFWICRNYISIFIIQHPIVLYSEICWFLGLLNLLLDV